MNGQLLKAMQRNQLMDMMYVDNSGKITKRRIKVIEMMEETFSAYCFLKHAKRTFKIENVLALVPVIRREREVI